MDNDFSFGKVVRIKTGWESAGRRGRCLTGEIEDRYGISWIGVEWDDEDDPDWQKARSLEVLGWHESKAVEPAPDRP